MIINEFIKSLLLTSSQPARLRKHNFCVELLATAATFHQHFEIPTYSTTVLIRLISLLGFRVISI